MVNYLINERYALPQGSIPRIPWGRCSAAAAAVLHVRAVGVPSERVGVGLSWLFTESTTLRHSLDSPGLPDPCHATPDGGTYSLGGGGHLPVCLVWNFQGT